MQAKAISAANPEEAAKVLYDADNGSTFVTGGGIPGRVKKSKKQKQQKATAYDEEVKFYDTFDDELLDRVDKTE